MSKGNEIEFPCVSDGCRRILYFSVTDPVSDEDITCPSCMKRYKFDASLMAKLKKFDNLVKAVRDAEEILGDVHVGVDVEGHSVQVPYRILLTRMNTFLNLRIGDREVRFRFRVEPLNRDS